MESVEQVLGGGPESLSSAELDRRNGDVHGVDEVGLQELPNGGNAAPEPSVLAVSGVVACCSASAGVASRKWNVVSASVKLGR